MLRIGCGAGFAGDQLAPSIDLIERGDISYLVLECLAERTIAIAQRAKAADQSGGYDSLAERRVRSFLKPMHDHDVRLVSNFGAANPLACGEMIIGVADEYGLASDAAVLLGDDVLDVIDRSAPAWEDGIALEAHGDLLSANAYLGADALLAALRSGARSVITGRVADPPLFVACMADFYDWDLSDLELVARATVIGHLLECGPQVSGGYFANPPFKTVPDLAHMGYPIAEIDDAAHAIITKTPGSGGLVDIDIVTEQLLYEVLDPNAYITPDVIADFTTARLEQIGEDQVAIIGGNSAGRPNSLKVSVGYNAGFRCEAEISYGGAGALARARLAGEVVRERLAGHVPDLHLDVIGVDSLHGSAMAEGYEPYECRLRAVGMHPDRQIALAVGDEVTALYTSGPAGGSGLRVHSESVVGVLSSTIPREMIETRVVHLKSAACS